MLGLLLLLTMLQDMLPETHSTVPTLGKNITYVQLPTYLHRNFIYRGMPSLLNEHYA